MKKRSIKIVMVCFVLLVLGIFVILQSPYRWIIIKPKFATIIDSYNGVNVHYNGNNPRKDLRSKTADGYNLGLKYQCVEFVKRYYYEKLKHKMPESFGHAKSFIIPSLRNGALNKQRNLVQHKNGSKTAPAVDDILVFGPSRFNEYGHIAIVVSCNLESLDVIQQNVGCRTRANFKIKKINNGYWVQNSRILGWLNKP
jgi:hypothetical protein